MVWGLLILRLDDLAKIVGRREGYVKNMAAATTKNTSTAQSHAQNRYKLYMFEHVLNMFRFSSPAADFRPEH